MIKKEHEAKALSINQPWPKSLERATATAIMLPHETTKQMRELLKEIREND